MFDINASWDERGCYQKWNKLIKQHRHRNVRQPYYQQGRMDAWEREYTRLQEEMRREMMFLRKQRIMREREQIAYNEQLAIAKRVALDVKRELNRKRRKEAKMQRAQESFEKMQSPRRSARVASK